MFGMVTCAVSGRVRNSFHPQRREADVRGPRDTRARLQRPREGSGVGWLRVWKLGRGSTRCWADAEKTTRDPFPIFKFLFLLISQADGK
jgi:hypothetical protein